MIQSFSLSAFNSLAEEKAANALTYCCGASRWVSQMTRFRPFPSLETLLEKSTLVWNQLGAEDWKEAFSHHPQIGDLKSLESKFSNTKTWAEQEQKGAAQASSTTLKELALANQKYQNQFGYIFIVCATGKTAEEMLTLLRNRLNNSHEEELKVAAAEQDKITRLRLEKLIYV